MSPLFLRCLPPLSDGFNKVRKPKRFGYKTYIKLSLPGHIYYTPI